MRTVRLSTTGLKVSAIGLGTIDWGDRVDEYTAADLLREFVSKGGNLVDIVDRDSSFVQTQVAARAISKAANRADLVLSASTGAASHGRDGSARYLLNQLEATLKALGTDHLDLWSVGHWDSSTPVIESMAAIHDAVRRGLVRYAGIGYGAGWQAALAHERYASLGSAAAIACIRTEYSLLNRRAERDLIPAADYLNISSLAYAPLARGVLTGKYRDAIPGDSRGADDYWMPLLGRYLSGTHRRIVDATVKASDGLGVPPSHVALAWLRDMPSVASTIVGARTVVQLGETLMSESLTLPPQIHDALTDVSEGAR